LPRLPGADLAEEEQNKGRGDVTIRQRRRKKRRGKHKQ